MRHFLLILIGLLITVSCQKDFYLEDLNDANRHISELQSVYNDLVGQNEELQVNLDTANAEIADLADLLTVANAELMTSEEENADLLEQVSGLTSDLEALQSVADDLQTQLDATQADLDAALAQTEVDSDRIADLTDELNDLQAQYDDLVANPIIEIQEVIRTVVRNVPGPTVTNTVTNTVYIDIVQVGDAVTVNDVTTVTEDYSGVPGVSLWDVTNQTVDGYAFFNVDGTVDVDVESGDASLSGVYASIEEFNTALDAFLNPVATQTADYRGLLSSFLINNDWKGSAIPFTFNGVEVYAQYGSGNSWQILDDADGEILLTYYPSNGDYGGHFIGEGDFPNVDDEQDTDYEALYNEFLEYIANEYLD